MKLRLPQIKISVNNLTLLALFLSLGFLLVFLLILLDAGAEPKGPQGTSPVAVSAQGFVGVRELIKAQGGKAGLNRTESGPERLIGDVAVITLGPDDVGESLQVEFRRSPDELAAVPQGIIAQSVEELQKNNRFFTVPSADWSKSIMANPVGTRAVLIILPKWYALKSSKHVGFAMTPTLVGRESIQNSMALLSPVVRFSLAEDDPRLKSNLNYRGGKVYDYTTGTKVYQTNDNELIAFDLATYDLRQGVTHKAVKRRNVITDPEFDESEKGDHYLDELVDSETPLLQQVAIKIGGKGQIFDVGNINGLQTVSGANLEPVILASNGQPVLSRVRVLDGPAGPRSQPRLPVYVLSEPDLLNNQILSDPKKVVAAMAILETVAGQPVSKTNFVFDGTFNGLSLSLDLFHRLSEPPYISIVLSVMILGLGLIWVAFVRFGVPQVLTKRSALGQGVRVLADNTARLMAVALKDSQLAPAYARHIRDTVLRGQRLGLKSGGLSADDAADRLSDIYKTTHKFKDLTARAAKPVTAIDMLKLCKDLHHWKTECQSAHRQ